MGLFTKSAHKMQTSQQITLTISRLALAIGIAFSTLVPFSYARAEQPTAATTHGEQQAEFTIPAQPLNSALLRFAEQAGLQILLPTSGLLDGMQATPLQGRYPVNQALRRLIGNNPVDYQISATGQITLSKRANKGAAEQTIIIKAARIEHEGDWIYDQPRAISVISREQMDNRPARHAADMLEQSAGVYSSVSQQDPALSVNIRGIQDYGRVNMNIDGMRQNFQKSGHGQRNGQMYIDSELLSGVTIEKGATSGMGGAGAFGGIATFNTVSASDFIFPPTKEIGGRLHASTGDNGTQFIGSGILALGSETGDILLGASERHLGDYWPGNKGDIGDIRTSQYTPEATQAAQDSLKNAKVLDSNYTMRSRLAKIGWNLPANQRLELSYLQTQTSTPNPSIITSVGYPNLGWTQSGFSEVMSRSSGLDYSLKPDDQDWLDFKAKLYYVDTKDDSDTYASSTTANDAYSTNTRLRTYGLQAQNTSRFYPTAGHELTANYGLDLFYDKATSDSTLDSMNGVTPNGNRSVASLFANLEYDYNDWLTLQGGMRYDRYHLRGSTGFTSFDFPWTVDNPCTERSAARCSVAKTHTYDIDDEHGKFSPTAAIAIKPGVDWLELYGSYGMSYRPPAITETLTTGSAHSSSVQYPNPFLQAERSRTWETGFNIKADNLITDTDRLVAKVSYFDTKVSNYINMELARVTPGLFSPSTGNAAYVNNLSKTRFRGLEYQLNYDAGVFYADLTYTHMIGKNDFCSKQAWMGGVISYAGSSRNYYAVPLDDWNNFVQCNTGAVFGSAAYLPNDRASLTLGGRAFERKLDFGVTIRYNKGYQDHSVINDTGTTGQFYVADWPKYTLFDLYASYQLTHNLRINGSIENITNRAYIVSYGDALSYTLGRGRTVQGGITYEF